MQVFDCQGNAFAMGAAQGERYQEQIQGVSRLLAELVPVAPGAQRTQQLVYRLTPVLAALAARLGERDVGRDLARHYPEMLERSRGIAHGAQVPLRQLYVIPFIELLLNRPAHRVPTPGGCTAVAVTRSRSRDGTALIAKNFDYPPIGRHTYLVRRSRPQGRAASLEIGHSPLAGCHEGVNEHGLAVTYNYGYFAGPGQARVPITNLVQELLERCGSVAHAIEHLGRRPRSGGALLMLADADGDIASVELAPTRMAVRRGDALAHANHALTEEVAACDIPRNAVFLPVLVPRSLRGTRVHESSEHRTARATALLEALGPAGPEELETLLADHGPGHGRPGDAGPGSGGPGDAGTADADAAGRGDDRTICRHGPYNETTCAVVLLPRQRAMRVLWGAPCQERFTQIEL